MSSPISTFITLSWCTWLVVILLTVDTLVEARRGKFKDKDKELLAKMAQAEAREGQNKTLVGKVDLIFEERERRYQASVIVLIVFLFVTIGMFLCCRYIPELVMDKCNY